jgi:ferredoxin
MRTESHVDTQTGPRLRIDPVACDGVGICAHLAPDLVRTDSWGFPLIDATRLRGGARRAAARAVAGCPRRALFLSE